MYLNRKILGYRLAGHDSSTRIKSLAIPGNGVLLGAANMHRIALRALQNKSTIFQKLGAMHDYKTGVNQDFKGSATESYAKAEIIYPMLKWTTLHM